MKPEPQSSQLALFSRIAGRNLFPSHPNYEWVVRIRNTTIQVATQDDNRRSALIETGKGLGLTGSDSRIYKTVTDMHPSAKRQYKSFK